MNQARTNLAGLEVVLTAHQEASQGLLLVSLKSIAPSSLQSRKPTKIAVVIDRSGSMGGPKIEITRQATEQFITTLGQDDRIAVVSYDDQVKILSEMERRSGALAKAVSKIGPGGSTNLYGGWFAGAKLAGRGGRVILLSDGQANIGRYTTAPDLAAHAGMSYEKYGVTTTTIGIGNDYDEAVMSGMAKLGHGSHYFAATTGAIRDAFSQERFSADSIRLERVSIRVNGQDVQLGHFWEDELKERVFPISDLASLELTLRYTNRTTGERTTERIEVPRSFGYSDEVKLAYLLELASNAEADMLEVRDPRSATQMRVRLREVVLALMAHPQSDTEEVSSIIQRLSASMARLEALEVSFEESNAMVHRKLSAQTSFNLREPAKAFSDSIEDARLVDQLARKGSGKSGIRAQGKLNPDAFALAPLADWIRWQALPVGLDERTLVIEVEDPRSGFLIHELQTRFNRTVKAEFAGITSEEIIEILRNA